jgi:hypothetical protein
MRSLRGKVSKGPMQDSYHRQSQPNCLGEELSEHINTHDGDVVCLLSGGSALDEFIQISDTRECRTWGVLLYSRAKLSLF